MKPSSGLQPEKQNFRDRLARLGIDEDEVEERFSRSSGPGGQHVNKVSTAVTLTCRGVSITVQDSRSQAMNRQLARERLLEAIIGQRAADRAERRDAAEKKRRQNRKRPAGVKKRILEGKRRRSETKKLRGKI